MNRNLILDLLAEPPDACVPGLSCPEDCAAECQPTCPRCGTPVAEDALCCRECGEDVRWDVEVASW